ncbi:uncharacterized protein [Misgurnus anguillicaudatus]|uniref:uncharacterized protein isoform X1 n=1 Tax=Misgurnus anguillicaudatus TaxID=75329 RepID=UPI003CCF3DD6
MAWKRLKVTYICGGGPSFLVSGLKSPPLLSSRLEDDFVFFLQRRISLERAEYMSWTESMEMQKAASEEEISRLRRQVLELEASLSNRQQQLEMMGADLEMQKKSVEDLTLQKSKAEYEVQKYRIELEGAIKSKGSIDQELNRARQQVQQSEAKQASLEESLRNLKKSIEDSTLARKKLEDHLRRKDSDVQGLEEHSRTLQRELRAKEDVEAGLLSQVRIMEMDLAHKSDVRIKQGEALLGFAKEGAQLSTFTSSSQILRSDSEAEALHHKMEELAMGKKRAETEIKTLKSELNSVVVHKTLAEEKAQRFKELLEEANNRLLKLQVEMEADRSNMRQKSEELRQESSEVKKSVYMYQEQIKSLQRDKSALDQRVLFHKTEVDGLKEQLKVNQAKLLQWNSYEQESSHKLRCLEDELSSKQTEVEQITFKMNELNRKNQLLESDTRHLRVSIESLQQDKTHADQKIKTLKGESEVLKEQLQRAKDEINLKTRTEKEAQVKIKNLELELQKNSVQATQLTKKVEELKKINMETERSVKNVKADLDRANLEIVSKEQQINILKTQTESAKSQIKIVEEELLNKSQISHELQIKLKDYNEETKKATELQQEIHSLTLTITNYEKDITNLKSELNSASTERNLANRKVQEQKAEINNLNMSLKKAMTESQRESSESKKNMSKVRELENELVKCKQTISRISGSSEKATVSLKQDISSLQRDKQTADQKLQALKVEFDDLSSTLKRTKDELQRMTEECMSTQFKLKESEAELQRKSSVIRELSSNTDKSVLNLKQELAASQKEKNSAEEKISSLNLQMLELKQKLKQTQEELKQKQKDLSSAELRSQKLGEQLDNCKKMLDDLKGKLDLQKKGYETQLQLVQAEMEQKLSLQESRLKQDYDRKSKVHSHTAETAEKANKHLSQEVEKLKASVVNVTKSKQEAEHQLSNLQARIDESERQRGILDLELLKAKSKISELETEKIRVNSSIFQLDSIQKDSSNEIERLKKKLTDTEQKLDISEKEAKSLKDQMVAHIKEIKSLQEKNLKQELVTSQKERSSTEEKISSLNHQILELKQKLRQTQEELKQKQKEAAAAELKSQKLGEQSNNYKKMLDDLNGKLDLQKKGYETQLQLVQAEMEQKLSLQESRFKQDYDRRSKVHSHTAETAERENKNLSQEIEKLKASIVNVTKSKQDAEHELGDLQARIDESERQRRILDLELLKAKSTISELETEKIRVNTSIYQLDSIQKDSSNEIERLQKKLTETEQKLEISEKEARSLKDQIVAYIKEMKSLQEKNLKLEVTVSSEQKHLKELEALGQTNHQCAKDSELLKLKTELQLIKKTVATYEEAKRSLEGELMKLKMSYEISAMEKEKVLEELRQVKMQVIGEKTKTTTENSISFQSSTVYEKQTNQVMVTNSQSEITDHTVKKSSLYDKGRSGKSQSVSFNIADSESSIGSDSSFQSTSHKIKGLRGRISIKKLIKTKIITQEIALKLQMGLITIEEVEASLAQFIGKPCSIAGVYVESSKKKMSFMDAVKEGLISKSHALELLEAQAATGCIIDPMTGEGYSPLDAVQKGIISEDLKDKISDAYKAVSGYTHAGKILSVFQAMEERILDRHRGKAIIETQIATGGLIHPLIGIKVPMDCALEQGLINQATLQSLYDPVSNPKDFHYPDTGQKAYYSELLRISVYDVNGGVYLLPFGDQHLYSVSPSSKRRVSVINTSNGAKMSGYEAYKAGYIDKTTYLFLAQQESEWQETTVMDSSRNHVHILKDHKSGRQLCIENALSLKILRADELSSYRSGQLSIFELADLLISRRNVSKVPNSPVAGLWEVSLKKRLPFFKGLQQNVVDRLTALRMLEAQACTGGICDPASGERVSITEAQRRGLLDEGFVRQLQQCEQAYYGIIHPQSKKTLTVAQAMQENLFPKDVGLRCLEFQLATGGLIIPDSQERVSLEVAIQNCLIDKATAAHLKHDPSQTKSITCPKTKRKMTFMEALEKSVIDSHTGFLLLEATKSHSTGNTSSFQYFYTYQHF